MLRKILLITKNVIYCDFSDCYNEILEQFYVEQFKSFDVKYTPQHLLERLRKSFGDKIQVIVMHQKKLIAPRDGCVINDGIFSQFQDFELLSRAALMLRKKVLLIAKKPLPRTLKVSDNIAGECEIPKDLADFAKSCMWYRSEDAKKFGLHA